VVDFSKRLRGRTVEKPANPVRLYDALNRKHDNGPLRPAQTAVIEEWFSNRQGDRDVIGLLMLQSRLNAGSDAAVYLCPNNFLIEQTAEQAEQFGIRVCTTVDELPDDFLSAQAILITSVQKMFKPSSACTINRRRLIACAQWGTGSSASRRPFSISA
jgi:hypothetical protein